MVEIRTRAHAALVYGMYRAAFSRVWNAPTPANLRRWQWWAGRWCAVVDRLAAEVV